MSKVERDLEIARNLVRAGVPIFVAAPCPGDSCIRPGCKGEFHIPQKWETSVPTLDVIDRWRDGWAICAVMGHAYDVLDIDPRNGANPQECQQWMDFGGVALTPSGGVHLFTKPLGVGKAGNILPGVDLQGGKPDGSSRGFVYIAPTQRISKATDKLGPYVWLTAPANPPQGDNPWAAEIVKNRSQPAPKSPNQIATNPTPPAYVEPVR
jgi:hypothetical protein